jgi:hypothetical protein
MLILNHAGPRHVSYNLSKENVIMPKETTVAYHEAGHAVIAWRLHLLRKKGASILREAEDVGRVHTHSGRGERPDVSWNDRAHLRVERSVVLSLAGVEAQRKYSPSSVRGHHWASDRDQAIRMLSCIAEPSGDEFPIYWKLLKIRTKEMVRFHWRQIEAVAARLLISKSLSGDQIREVIIESYKLRH